MNYPQVQPDCSTNAVFHYFIIKLSLYKIVFHITHISHLSPYPHQERFQLRFVQLLHDDVHHNDYDDDDDDYSDDDDDDHNDHNDYDYDDYSDDDDDDHNDHNDYDYDDYSDDNDDLERSIGASLMGGQHGDNVLTRKVPFARQLIVLK